MSVAIEIRVDADIAGLIPALSPEELVQLEANIVAEGCRDPLVAWAEKGILLDGHNRHRICQERGIEFDVRELSFADRNAAMAWVIRNQFGRRNLTPYNRGELALKLVEVESAEAIARKARQMREANDAKSREWLRSQGPEAAAIVDVLDGSPKRIHAKPNRIYVAVDDAAGRAKIGCATDPAARIKDDIQKHVPHARLERWFYGDRAVEAQIHEHLAEYRLNNEWFRWDAVVSGALGDFLDLANISQIETAEAVDALRSAAEVAGISRANMTKVGFLDRHADEPTKEKLRRGEVSINAAHKAATKKTKRKEKEKRKAAVPPNLPAATDRYRVITGDLAQVSKQVDNDSVDWIITDPPYGRKQLDRHCIGQLRDFASDKLKPGGSLLCMMGQSYLPEVLRDLGGIATFRYQWTLAYLTPGGQASQLWGRNVNCFWKPVLWYVKGEYKGDWVGDVCSSEVNDNDKDHHHWGQSESGMADIIERFTYPGEIICDPFCGGGTTGVVAVQKKRLFVGIDCDEECTSTTLKRLAEVAS